VEHIFAIEALLEEKNRYIVSLEQLLRQHGIEPPPKPGGSSSFPG